MRSAKGVRARGMNERGVVISIDKSLEALLLMLAGDGSELLDFGNNTAEFSHERR